MRKPLPSEFRPAPVKLGDKLRIGFFALIALGGVRAIIVEPGQTSTMLLGVGLLMTGAASWLAYRLHWPGSPRLVVDAKALEYRRGDKVQRLAWRQVEAIEVDWYRDEMHFVAKDGHKVKTYFNMMSDDGQSFLGLMEEYWTPPKSSRSGQCAG